MKEVLDEVAGALEPGVTVATLNAAIAVLENRRQELSAPAESLIDEARRMQAMQDQGLTVTEIAEILAIPEQNVLNRLRLLRLRPEEQQRVHTGQMGLVTALEILNRRRREGGE
jgi:DNA-directed RNA polymerase specialized sigma24 family protein